MKRKIKLIIITTSIMLNLVLCYFLFFKKDKIDRIPPWHPFKLNSNLNLKSIVENGYKFDSSPCGQVQYTKQIADTIIQYEVGIDCNDYKGQYDYSSTLGIDIEEEDENSQNSKEVITSKENFKTIEEMISENKYYPWNIKEINNCFQQIKWRVFTIKLGKKIDSLSLKKFIYRKGGRVINLTKVWNSKNGGSFMVYHTESNLYFLCSLSYREDNWEFKIIRTIPFLDQKLIKEDKEYRIKRDNYFNQNINVLQQGL
ncbi:hypothetical protein [uncultured Tenacibaculum sp.]|uniref:hypothetical protein n=1 Tax=uncultured Tenacibaculum sp. TaxID=174713 RepID=UPI00260C35DC|nr:hypothetical protein [uncultured Tenacibaculum sp.]